MASWRETSVDDPEAHDLLAEYFASRARGFPGGPRAYRTVFPVAADFTPSAGVFLVIDQDGIGIGCGGVRRISPGDGGLTRYEVKHIWVQPSYRGKGHGRLLLAELEHRAHEFGAAELVLDTNASLEAAASLYSAAGYVPIPAYNENPNATNWYRKALG
jgi:GNAT superfamily N-acetyltransferase